jgi:hypothetical protein
MVKYKLPCYLFSYFKRLFMDLVKKLENEERTNDEKLLKNKNLNTLFKSFNLKASGNSSQSMGPSTSSSDSFISQANFSDILKELQDNLDDFT